MYAYMECLVKNNFCVSWLTLNCSWLGESRSQKMNKHIKPWVLSGSSVNGRGCGMRVSLFWRTRSQPARAARPWLRQVLSQEANLGPMGGAIFQEWRVDRGPGGCVSVPQKNGEGSSIPGSPKWWLMDIP